MIVKLKDTAKNLIWGKLDDKMWRHGARANVCLLLLIDVDKKTRSPIDFIIEHHLIIRIKDRLCDLS